MEEIDRILAENLKLMRGYIFLKRKVILLTAEKEERERKILSVERDFNTISNDFYNLRKSYNNIKEMQNHIEYEYLILSEKFKKLEEIVLSYEKEKDK